MNELTEEMKAHIDSLDMEALLHKARFAPVGDPAMIGDVGAYWLRRLSEVRKENPGMYTAVSKKIGWGDTMTLEEKKAQFPHLKFNYEPKKDCKYCNGKGLKRNNNWCICLFVRHDFCEEAGKMVSEFARKELNRMKEEKGK